MVEHPGTAALYIEAHRSFDEFARTLTETDWATPAPCTPAWTVRDVLSHVSGVPDDGLAGRTEGAATEPWTASQVDRNRGFSVAELLDRWAGQAAPFAGAIEAIGEPRPPFDCHSHEHDIRHALGKPGNRQNAIVEASGLGLVEADEVAGPVTVELVDGRSFVSGDAAGTGAVAVRGLTMFEVFRSRLGRRSRAQVRAYDWDGEAADIERVVDRWFVFGPSAQPIEE